MMNDTKQIQAFYEHDLAKKLKEMSDKIKAEGFSRDVYTELRCLEEHINRLNAVRGFVNAWHSEGEQSKLMKEGA